MTKATKAGARNSTTDAGRLQQIHDLAVENGADCPGANETAKAGRIQGSSKGMGDAPNLRGAGARACWSCVSYKPIEGDWSEGRCAKFDFPAEEHWVCDGWAPIPQQPLQVVIVKDKGGNEMLSTDSVPAMLSIPTYIKSLHLPHDEQFIKDVLAVKFIGKDDIKGYAVLWGNEDLVDLESEFFTPQTDFWKNALGFPRPLAWNHAQDKNLFRAHPVVGKMMELGEDAYGLFYNAVLDRAHQYRKVVGDLIGQRIVGTSSDSAPQYVERVKTKKGATWLKTWPLFAVALSDVPCEPRMIEEGNVYWKSVGVDLPALLESSAEATAEAARAGFEQKMAFTKRDLELLKLNAV